MYEDSHTVCRRMTYVKCSSHRRSGMLLTKARPGGDDGVAWRLRITTPPGIVDRDAGAGQRRHDITTAVVTGLVGLHGIVARPVMATERDPSSLRVRPRSGF
jgi:hypothetical protein